MGLISYEISQNTSHGITVDGFNSTVIGSTEKPKKIYLTVTNHDKWFHEKGYKKQVTRNITYKDGKATYRLNGWTYDVSPILSDHL